MSCHCSENTIDNIKLQYKKLQYEAMRCYMQGDFQLAVSYYEKAFYQACKFFKLPQIPVESVNYLVGACNHCMEYCYARRSRSCYLRTAMKEVGNCFQDVNQYAGSRAAALTTYVQLSACLIQRLYDDKRLDEAANVLDDLENIWQKYSTALIVLH